MKKLVQFIIALDIAALFFFCGSIASAVAVFQPVQGGTGIGSGSGRSIGDCLKVGATSPFSWTTGTCGSGGSNNLATSTTNTAGQLLYWFDTNTYPAHIQSQPTLRFDGETLTVGNNDLGSPGAIYANSVSGGSVSVGVFNSLVATDAFGTLYSTSTPIAAWFIATSTSKASRFPFASTTAVTATTLCFTGDTCRTTWPTSGTGGSGNVSTSSVPVIGNLAYWTSTTATPALLANVATTSLAFSGPFSGVSSLGALVGGTNSTVAWTGLATTSQPSSSNLLVSNGAAGVYGAATTTATCSGTVSCSTFTILGTSPITLTGSGSGVWPFTTGLSNFATSTQATTTVEWFQTGVFASSTSQLVNANFWGNLTLKATSSALLATDELGNVIATTSIGTTLLTGILPISKGGTATSTLYAGGVLFYDGTLGTVSQPGDGKGLFYDRTNNRVGIASSSPNSTFVVQGSSGSLLYTTNTLRVTGTTAETNNGAVLLTPGNGSGSLTLTGWDSTGLGSLAWSAGSTRTLRIGNSLTTAAPGNVTYITFGGFTTANATTTHMVGINATSTPGALLSIAGMQGGTKPLLYISTSTSAGATTTVMQMDSNGVLGMGLGGAWVGIGTSTPQWPLHISAIRPIFGLTDSSAGSGLKSWTMSSQGGDFYIASSSDAGATSTIPALTIKGSGTASLSIGSTTQTLSAVNGLLTLGDNTGTSTVSTGKLQFDGYNTAGTRVCMFIVGTSVVIGSGGCTP